MRTTSLQSVHHEIVDEAPIGVRILNRLVILMAAGLTVTAFTLYTL